MHNPLKYYLAVRDIDRNSHKLQSVIVMAGSTQAEETISASATPSFTPYAVNKRIIKLKGER